MKNIPQPKEGWLVLTSEERKKLPIHKQSMDLACWDDIAGWSYWGFLGADSEYEYAVRIGSDLQKEKWPHLTPKPQLATSDPHYYVFNPERGAPTVAHEHLTDAQLEAERLAAKYPGESFEILACLGISHVVKPSTFWNDGINPDDFA